MLDSQESIGNDWKMVLKRPGKIEGVEPEAEEVDLELMEHLVKKSLDINPGLRQQRSTREFLSGIKKEAVAKSNASASKAAPVEKKKVSLSQRRKSTIEFFFEQKMEEYTESAEEVMGRIQLLEEELRTAQESTVSEIVDFLSMISGSANSPEAREVMREYRQFIKALGISEEEIIKACREG